MNTTALIQAELQGDPDQQGPGHERSGGAPKQPAVLIVEDEGIVAVDLQQTLIELGYDAYAIATSATEAIRHATERCPDVVLMDIRIQGERDGIETARILRDSFRVPVIFLTAHADEATLERAKQTDPYGYLTKPFRTPELRTAIEIAIYRSAMERRLRERERWFATTLHSIADAVVAVDLAGKVTFVNAEAERLIGLAADALIGRSSPDVLKLLDHRREAFDSPLEQAMLRGHPIMVTEGLLVNATTGSTREISDSAAPVVDEGRMLGAVMVFRDVTEQKEIQKQLELADRLASLGTMAAGVAHEVNNPLTVLLANTEIVERELVELRRETDAAEGLGASIDVRLDELTQAVSDIGTAGNRIRRIVADLRAFSRPGVSAIGRADIHEALSWAIRATAHELRLRAKVITEFGQVPRVIGDDGRLGQVFVNLLLNAAQAIAPGDADANEVRVSTHLERPGWISIEVRDTGDGIPEDALKHIFEPFFTTKPVGVGTGLGLSICHGIVKSLGGEMVVESRVGEGTLIRVLLRAAPREATAVEPSIAEAPKAQCARVLLIDDEPMVLRAIKRILSQHEVITSESAAEGLEMIARGDRFDLVISDLMMPSMTGMDLYEELLKRSPDLARSMVFITGGATTLRSEDFLRAVTNDRLVKPFSTAALISLVNRRLESTHPKAGDAS